MRYRRRYRRSIILLVLAALLPLVLLAAGLGLAWLNQQNETIEKEALVRVERTAAALERELSAQIVPLRLLAQTPLSMDPSTKPLFSTGRSGSEARSRSGRRLCSPTWKAIVSSMFQSL
jgi:hypothetical protein